MAYIYASCPLSASHSCMSVHSNHSMADTWAGRSWIIALIICACSERSEGQGRLHGCSRPYSVTPLSKDANKSKDSHNKLRRPSGFAKQRKSCR